VKTTFLALLCIIAACSILSLICAWHLVCNTTGVVALEARMDAVEAKADTLIVHETRRNKIGRGDYWDLRKMKKENDKIKAENDYLKGELKRISP
jgi:hypothetical protein